MPRSLPLNPNLDHLKKQARDLLRAFRRGVPEAVDRFDALRLKAAPRLSDALHAVAVEYGFESWPRLKEHVEGLTYVDDDVLDQARRAFRADDAAGFRRLLESHPGLKERINEPVAPFDAPLINHVRSREMLDVLLDTGADVNARSRWWAGGFGVLDSVRPDVAEHAIDRGAVVTVHAAARLGKLDELRKLIDDDPKLVDARGGDGQTPLHFASTVEVAAFLLDHGADIDARDVDHESTPAQYMVRTRQEVAKYLIRRGCTTDLLMAAALGDMDLARKHLDADPECIRMRVSDEYFPMVGSHNGGTIYQWELGWYVSAPQIADAYGHAELFDFLTERCPPDEKLINACWMHEEGRVRDLLARHSKMSMSTPLRRHVVHAARNNDAVAARLMLDAGLPVDGVFGQHHATALHWAAWHGNAALVRRILERRPQLENDDNEFNGTPIGWAVHGSENSWERKTGDYGATVDALLDAGARPPDAAQGTEAVRTVLRRRGIR